MASKRQIGAIIKLDGESTFRASIQNCKSGLAAMKAELQATQASYQGNANSLEALSAVQEQYAEIQKTAAAQVEKMSNAYEKSIQKEQSVKESLQQMRDAYEQAEKELKEMKESGEASAEALEEQAKKASDAYESYQRYETAVEKCGARTNYFKKALTEATMEEQSAAESVRQYAQYIDEARESADGAAHSIDEYGQAVSETGSAAGEAGDAMAVFRGVVGGNIATQALEKVVDLLKEGAQYAVQVGGDFDANMKKVQALSGVSGTDYTALKNKALEIGNDKAIAAGANDVAEAYSYMALAGYNARQMAAALPGVLNLATAAEMSLGTATDMVTDYISAFGLECKDSSHMVDLMAYAQANSNTSAEQLGEAWGNSAANLHAAGQSAETVTAILEALANQGEKSSSAGVKLAAVQRDITSKMQDGKIAIGDTTIAVQDSQGNFRDLIDILSDVEGAVDGMGNAQRAAALSSVFTDDSIKAVNMTLTEGTDKIAGYKTELENCDGAAAKMAATMKDNLQGDMQGLDSALEGLGIAAYQYVDGPLRSVVSGVTDIITGITDALTPQTIAIQEFIGTVKEAAKEVENLTDTAASDYASGMADTSSLRTYVDIIEELHGKTRLTEFEAFQLDNALNQLGSSVPELNQYLGNTNALLTASAGDYSLVSEAMQEAVKRQQATTIAAYRNQLVMASAQREIVKKQTQDAIAEADQEIAEQKEKLKKITEDKSLSFSERQDATAEQLSILDKANEARSDALKQQKELNDSYDENAAKIAALDAEYGSLYEELGLQKDATGKLVLANQDLADATDEATTAAQEQAEAQEQSSDAVTQAAQDYVKAAEEMKNANPQGVVRDQLAAAMEQVQQFKESVTGAMSSFSLFGDSDSLMDAYTQFNDREMKQNMTKTLDVMKTYAGELQSLRDKGMSDGFVEYLAGMGQSGLNYVHSLASLSQDELKEFQASYDEFLSYQNGTNQQVQNMLNDYVQDISAGIADGYDSWYQYGIQTTQGLLDALAEAESALESGLISGDMNSAIATILQARADSRNWNSAQANQQTQTTVNHSAPEAVSHNYGGDLTVNVTLDGEPIVCAFEKRLSARARIRGVR